MAENEKKTRFKRGENPNSLKNLKPFTSENQPESNGRPPGTPNRATVLKKWTDVELEIVNPITKEKEKATVEDEVVLSLIREARKGNIPAIKEVLDTLYGKISDKTELTVNVSDLTDEELEAIAKSKG